MPESTNAREARKATYVPLRVTARLRCGVLTDGALPLDAMLYYAAHREVLGGSRTRSLPRAYSHPTGEDEPRVGRLPLAIRNGSSPHWYYACSWCQWPEAIADGIDHWTKRLDSRYVALLEQQTARVPVSGGRYRAYRMPVAYRHALAVTWYVVGVPDTIRRLLTLVSHVGKKTAMGWGAVIAWEVEPWEADWSERGGEGQLMRALPAADGTLYGVRPPYWLPRHQTPCELPAVPVAVG